MRGLARREALGSDVALLAGCLLIALIAFALPRNWAGALVSTLRRSALRPAVVLQTRASEDRTSRFRLAEIQASRDSFALALLADTALRRENADLGA